MVAVWTISGIHNQVVTVPGVQARAARAGVIQLAEVRHDTVDFSLLEVSEMNKVPVCNRPLLKTAM